MLLLLSTIYIAAVYFIAKAWYKLYVVYFGLSRRYATENGEVSILSFSKLDDWDMEIIKSLLGKILFTNALVILFVFFFTCLYQYYYIGI